MSAATFVDVLRARAAERPDARAFLYLRNGEEEDAALTFAEFEQRARAAGARLAAVLAPGDRAILLYPQGLDFLAAFFGCLYAGIIPVPVSLPNRQRGIAVLRGIVHDCGAKCILSESMLLGKFSADLAVDEMLGAVPRFDTSTWSDAVDAGPSVPITGDTIALLQYTSGSTGTPRGVIVTHANLIDNHTQIGAGFGVGPDTVVASWLPMFHDMGLAMVMHAVWAGAPCMLMAPSAFLQKPERWLRTISRYRVTSSGAPDFAYELCVKRAKDARDGLDLSSWRMAFSGAEPVRATTIDRFSDLFAPCGFRRASFHPVYGLAEATVFVTSENPNTGPVVRRFSQDALQQGRVRPERADNPRDGQPFVSCGHTWSDTRLAIVDPETRQPVPPGRVGEIWLAGSSACQGYWNRPAETEATFDATLEDGSAERVRFLRTGDLGFVDRGQLFIAGRHKDLIIIRGRNHYPQDIETTAADSHPAIEPYGCAAFSIESDDGEKLVIAQELKRSAPKNLDAGEVVRAIRAAVSETHALHVQAVVLLEPGMLPRTSSGKVRRKMCRQGFLDRTLPTVASWVFWTERPAADTTSEEADAARSKARVADALIAWLRQYAATRINSRTIDERRTIPPSIVLDFGNRGLLGGMQIGTEYGGLGLGHVDTLRVIEQMGAIDMTIGLFLGINTYLGIRPIAEHASRALKDAMLPRLAAGRELVAFALTEPGAGSNPRALATRAVADGNGRWRLYGTKQWIGTAQWAGQIIVFARHPETARVTAFLVPQDAEGLRQGPESLTMGMRAVIQNTVYLDGVPVTTENILGGLGGGMDIAHDAMIHARMGIGAACLGVMKRSAQLAVRYASRRDIATGRLMAHPVTLEKLGRVTAGATALQCLLHAVARALDANVAVPVEAFAALKVVAPELAWSAIDDLVQLLGGRGYIETNPAAQMVRDARVVRIFEGPTETMVALVGARLLAGGGPVKQTIAEVLGAPALAGLVDTIATTVRDRMTRLPHALKRDRRAVHWSHDRAGQLATWALVIAAVEGERAGGTSAELDRAAGWARGHFEATLAAVRDGTPNEHATLDASEIQEVVGMYTRTIGDVEQQLPQDQQTIDPLLARAPSGAATAATASTAPMAPPLAGENGDRPAPSSQSALREWIVGWLANRLKIPASQIDSSRSFVDHGLDSLTAVELAQDLSEHLARELDEAQLWNLPTIDALVAHLEGGGAVVVPPAGAGVEPRRDQEILNL